ncbi:hypothetical protein M877_13790 [Streptomyces niveus NCIMB 11891]|nr:hypothetical protein M877_13790 [Streptomyces niveus NCIMB 11891]
MAALEMQQWRDGRKAAGEATEALREALAARGFPADWFNLRPVVAYSGRPLVHLGALPADVVEQLAEALRRDELPGP